MPVNAAHLLTAGDAVDNTSFLTASITPSANKLILAWVASVAGLANEPTLSGNGLTWVSIGTVAASSNTRITLFRAMGASPSAGQVTISFGAQSQDAAAWSISEFGDVDTSGSNGSGAVVQVATNSGNTTNLVVTLGAFSSADNATVGGFAPANNDADVTPGSGFTQLGEVVQLGATLALMTEWRNDNDTSVDESHTSSALTGGIAAEIKFSASGPPQARPRASVVMA